MIRTKSLREQLRVYFVVGSQDCQYSMEKTIEIAKEALSGGVGTLQLRDKSSKLSAEEQEQLAHKLQALCKEKNVLFFVNDDVELAVRVGADGIHVGQDDMTITEVRKLSPKGMLIGVSAGTVDEAIKAKEEGADYIGVGAMYHTASKADAGDPIGPKGLRDIRLAVGDDLPIVGIGGIKLSNAKPVIEAGADGVAVISAISKAASPHEAASALERVVTDGLANR